MDDCRKIEKRKASELKQPLTILTVDVGNTATKLTIFEDERPVHCIVGHNLGKDAAESILSYNSVDGIVYCCVGQDNKELRLSLEEAEVPFLMIETEAKLPVEIAYRSPGSLGPDRVAAAVGALGPQNSVLVVDAGTALTCDLVSNGVFLGGNISPGISLRFKSLHEFTSALPEVKRDGQIPPFGFDTTTAIRSGVVGGIIAEIKSAYKKALEIDDKVKMILTGGDAEYLARLLSGSEIDFSVDREAVGKGMVRIFKYNYKL